MSVKVKSVGGAGGSIVKQEDYYLIPTPIKFKHAKLDLPILEVSIKESSSSSIKYENLNSLPFVPKLITYGLNKFWISDGKSKIACSADCNAWIEYEIPTGTWNYLKYGVDTYFEKFILVSQSGKTIAYSSNGIDWSTVAIPSNVIGDGIIWNVSVSPADLRFYIGVKGGVYYNTSINCNSWQYESIGESANYCTQVVSPPYGSNKPVLLSSGGSTYYKNSGSSSWTFATSNGLLAYSCYGNDMYVSIHQVGTTVNYSTDGINWSSATHPSSSGGASDLRYFNGKFIFSAGTNCYYSTNLTNWNTVSIPISRRDIITSSSLALILDSDYNLWKTSDGISCNALNEFNITASIYANGIYLLFDKVNNIKYSYDGFNWSSTTRKFPLNNKYGVTYGNNKFIAVNNGQNIYSDDGINWTIGQIDSSISWNMVSYGSNKFVSIPSSGDVASYSNDGNNWINITLPASATWNCITYTQEKFILVGSNHTVLYSIDGVTWNIGSSVCQDTSNYNYQGLIYGNGKLILLESTKDTGFYSTDNGATWLVNNMPKCNSGNYWTNIIFDEGQFIALCYNTNQIATSINGTDWDITTIGIDKYHQMSYNSGHIFITGKNGNFYVKNPAQLQPKWVISELNV